MLMSVREMGVKVDRFRENQSLSCFQHLLAADIYVSRCLGALLDSSCLELQKRSTGERRREGGTSIVQ